jgi:hypothetical protein
MEEPKQKLLKVVNIDAQFPELKGGACNQRGRGTGSTVKAAGAAAWRNLLSQPKLKRKRFSTLTAVITVGTVAVGNPDTPIEESE